MAVLPATFAAAEDAPSQVVATAGVKAGDQWTYDVTDEITGNLKWTVTNTVTEVSSKEVVIRVSRRGDDRSGIAVFDGNWNVKEDGVWKKKPRGGDGVDLPLTVGKQWRISDTIQNLQNGVVLREKGDAKVMGRESITTPAGTFDTFKIAAETNQMTTNDGSVSQQLTSVMWFAPAVHRWVKRTVAALQRGHLSTSFTEELIDFSSRP